MPVGVSATVQKARVEPLATSVTENATVDFQRAKVFAIAEPLTPTVTKALAKSPLTVSVPLVPTLRKQLQRVWSIVIALVPSLIASKVKIAALSTTVRIGRQTASTVLSATQGFVASLTSQKFSSANLTTTQPTAITVQKRPQKILDIRALSLPFPPITQGLGMSITLAKQNLGVLRILSLSQPSNATASKLVNKPLLTTQPTSISLVRSILKRAITTITLVPTVDRLRAKILSTSTNINASVNKQIAQAQAQFSTTQTITADVFKRRTQFLSTSTNTLANLNAIKIRFLQILTAIGGLVATIRRDSATTFNSSIEADAILTNQISSRLSTAISTSATIRRFVSITRFVAQPLNSTLRKFNSTSLGTTTHSVIVVVKQALISKSTSFSQQVSVFRGFGFQQTLSAAVNQIATLTRSSSRSNSATTSPVAVLVRRPGKKLATTVHGIATLVRVPTRIIGIPGQAILRNITARYTYLKNESPIITTLRNFFNG